MLFKMKLSKIITLNSLLLVLIFLIPADYILPTINLWIFNITIFKLIGIAILGLWTYKVYKKEVKLKLDILGLLIAFFLLSTLFSALFSDFSAISLNYSFRILFYLILYLIILSLNINEKFLEKIVFTIILSGLFFSITGILQHFSLISLGLKFILGSSVVRASGFVGDPNEFGVLLIAILPFAFFSYFKEKNTNKKLICALSFFTILIASLFTFSRSVLLALILILLIMLFKKRKTKESIMLLAVIALIFLLAYPELIKRLDYYSINSGIEIRQRLVYESLDVFKNNPILGSGLNTIPYFTYRNTATHNLYIQMLAETGIFGFIFFIAILCLAFKNTFKNSSYFSNALQLSLLSYLIVNFFMSFLYDKFLWLLIALTALSARQDFKTRFC